MPVLLTSANTSIERLLIVAENRPGTVHRLSRDETLAGGKAVNISRVLAQLSTRGIADATAHLVGFLGGATGRLCGDLLTQEQLAGTWVDTAQSTRISEVLVDLADPAGATVYNARGPEVTGDEVDELERAHDDALAAGASGIVCTGSVPPGAGDDFYARLVATAHRRGRWSLVDASGAILTTAAAQSPTIIKLNRDELAESGGDAQLDRWLDGGVRCVIVTDGAAPTLVRAEAGEWRARAPRIELRSAVGSGDAFAAGLVAQIEAAGLDAFLADPEAALRLACACGAANATSLTAGLPADADLPALMAQTAIERVR